MLYFCSAKRCTSIVLNREFTSFVKGFINFGFWFWRPLMLVRGLFFA